MKRINYNEPKKVHFIGIGGISMSGLAEILLDKGFRISGSDQNTSPITARLETLGMRIYQGHHATNIDPTIDLVVYTAAISEENPELQRARALGIETMDRATLLGDIMTNYAYSIGVAGTHGKTTTTSMLANILLAADTDPTISVGGLLDSIQGNIRIGKTSTFLTEACEYTNSFLKFNPYIGVILNVEEDHMDFFKDIHDIINSFRQYANRIHPEGYLIVNKTIPYLEEICKETTCKVITCGIEDPDADFCAKHIAYKDNIYPMFDIYHKEECLGRVELNVPGEHNVYNAVMSYATAYALDIPFDEIKNGLYNFRGTKKRFELKGDLKGITIIDDYAHHPTEIEVTLKVARNRVSDGGKVWCVFQPHTYSRTKAFLQDFADSLALADHVILADIYAARESDPGDIHSKDLLALLEKKNVNVTYYETFEEIEDAILENCCPGDLLITLGAGNIAIVGEELLGL